MNVTWYSIVSRFVRANRSISRSPGDDPRVLALRFVVSTTSVDPSQWPRATAHVRADRRRQRRTPLRRRIDRDDARIVDQLVGDGDDARGLDDAEVGVIDRGKHRVRESSTMDDAADTEAVVLVGVARLAALQAAAPLHGNRSGGRHARREPAVGRIDDERGSPRRRVVFTPVRDRRVRRVDLAREHVNTRQIAFVADPNVFEAFRVFRVGEEPSRAVRRRTLEGHTVFPFAGPLAL